VFFHRGFSRSLLRHILSEVFRLKFHRKLRRRWIQLPLMTVNRLHYTGGRLWSRRTMIAWILTPPLYLEHGHKNQWQTLFKRLVSAKYQQAKPPLCLIMNSSTRTLSHMLSRINYRSTRPYVNSRLMGFSSRYPPNNTTNLVVSFPWLQYPLS
jgi:hypothetical protein